MSAVRTSRLRRADGRPGGRVRILAGLIVLGLLAITAPLFVFPLVTWLSAHL
jgi:hypothetical protein